MIKLLCRRCHILYICRIVATPSVWMSSPPWLEACPGLAPGMWCDLGLPAWQHGSDAVKCHFSVSSQKQQVAAGPYPWWWEANGVTVKGQTTSLMNTVWNSCIHFKFGGNIFILYMIFQNAELYFCQCENNGSMIILIPMGYCWLFFQEQRQAET